MSTWEHQKIRIQSTSKLIGGHQLRAALVLAGLTQRTLGAALGI